MTDPLAVVVGFGVTGRAVARHLVTTGHEVLVIEDKPAPEVAEEVAATGATLVEMPTSQAMTAAITGAALVSPSPGVKPSHPALTRALELGVPIAGELELAWRYARVPIVAVTGTNGKTTVTTLVGAMLVESGVRAIAAGNIGFPLVDALGADVDVIVAEVSSFQLWATTLFRPVVGAWLNLEENHLDWHPSIAHYAASKARIWANQGREDIAVANATDSVVMAEAHRARSRLVSFGGGSGWHERAGHLVAPSGEQIVDAVEMPRALPHDVMNALAATATAVSGGASLAGCRAALTRFVGLPHRLELVGEAGGVRWYNDSNATTPTSVLAALRAFDSVVLIAGGHNKGTDLTVIASEDSRVRAVVAIGEAADEIQAVFSGRRPVAHAESMDAAVRTASDLAQPGDVVLLSPGCASYDWYRSYIERGEDFVRAVSKVLS